MMLVIQGVALGTCIGFRQSENGKFTDIAFHATLHVAMADGLLARFVGIGTQDVVPLHALYEGGIVHCAVKLAQ